ncbi:SHOCT domain-containing protein [Bradyrhizobium sp. 156]|uniref:DUF4429 domain-containing protein n=1 Tax=Bradyrhizobium sp. 156 TaxID=2782630 RepID=UPI001FF8A4CF|nr:SHOCT domain-containing protein [Bradyrhizobium sp. 156]
MGSENKKPRWQKILELEAKANEKDSVQQVRTPVLVCKGRGAKLELHDDFVIIRRGLFWGLVFQHGIKGDKQFQFSSVSAVQFKPPGLLKGYIQFTLGGAVENTGGVLSAAHDENTVLFSSEIDFAKARQFIEAKLTATSRTPAPSPVERPITVAEQLERLAGLLDRGLLTLDEFNAQKAKLLLME